MILMGQVWIPSHAFCWILALMVKYLGPLVRIFQVLGWERATR